MIDLYGSQQYCKKSHACLFNQTQKMLIGFTARSPVDETKYTQSIINSDYVLVGYQIVVTPW
jgi:hypothetical protein